MSQETIETIKSQIEGNPILLYIERLAASAAVRVLGADRCSVSSLAGERFAYVDILGNPDIRATLPEYANWPTFPQLYVNGELVGGCDIVTEMFQAGELQPLIKEAAASEEEDTA